MPIAVARAPASVGNVAVGFDVLGHTVHGPVDTATVRRVPRAGVRITALRGVVVDLPTDAPLNTAGAALLSLSAALALPFGFEVELDKGIPLGSGLGGSAASAVAALVAANALLDRPLSREELVWHAVAGEQVASGSPHADNVAPQLLGGLVLALTDRVVPIPVPAGLWATVVHPHTVLETRVARGVLKDPYPLSAFVAQSGHLAAFLAGCFSGDLSLVRAGLVDVLVEPRRAPLVPGFAAVRAAALAHGALGASISGAGPSVFGWFGSEDEAQRAGEAMSAAFAGVGLGSDVIVSALPGPRAEVVSCAA
jgi:homoserine kinase